jgi:hypothetical protein
MDDEAELVMFEIEHDPWAVITEPLPESLNDLDALKRLRPIVYAVIHTFTWSLDDPLGPIARLVEIDRRIALIERDHPTARSLPIFFGKMIEAAQHRHSERFSTGLPRVFGDSLDQYLVPNAIKLKSSAEE